MTDVTATIERTTVLDKTYDAATIEPRITATWDEAKAFAAGRGAIPGEPSFTIVIPPPNVTGSLHMGHALNNTLQDILIRFERMRGKDVLWQPGMDHAGIATQMVVERQLMETQQPDRRELGREEFVRRVWEWKEQSGGTIANQLKRLGASCDWSRERFTMDEGLSRAVLKVFVELHRKGLIYRDKRLVNWDPKFLTAISDLEVVPTEVNGHLWYFRYPIEGELDRFITVATTRPETMLGDTAVAVHPEDERYADLIGRQVVLPLVGRHIPIVADEYADPEKGAGAVKITPAHDFNDFEVGKRHELPMISVLDVEAAIKLSGNAEFWRDVGHGSDLYSAGEEPLPIVLTHDELVAALDGLDRFEARKVVVDLMQARGLLEKIEPNRHAVPHGDRSGVVIEPFLTDQWYVDAKTLAQPAIAAVRQGRTAFVPKSWENTYFQWMENIQPWCISRQLWWGHQIPAWYGPDGYVFVAYTEKEAYDEAIRHYLTTGYLNFAKASDLRAEGPASGFLKRDEDVLDTWFSSALWPFSTLGWPDKTPELARYYPTSVLVTGFDIIFFWVARMMMSGIEFMKTEPFHTVYIHALVRDEKGAKMSKSKGNVIDPLNLIDKYGADALRFTLAAMAAQGRDIKLAIARVEGYGKFATKLWNAARFAELNGCLLKPDFAPDSVTETLNRWIVVETARAVAETTAAIEAYRFNDAANAVYRFVWNTFCDWYLELAKPVLQGEVEEAKGETRATCAWAIDQILKILHPFMPFLTEELWAKTAESAGIARDDLLVLSRWPNIDIRPDGAADEVNWLVDLISEIRSVRAEMNVPAAAQVPLVLVGAGQVTKVRLVANEAALKRLARISDVTLSDNTPAASAQIIAGEATACLPLEGIIDFAAERKRLTNDQAKLGDEIAKIDVKLNNPQFLAKAKEEAIEEQRDRHEAATQRLAKVKEALRRLM
ncbi:MAG: valine--tRNA ligase [Ancalomicrobiaceae bacterium]|nr:valine--tRNA ligase [Ancalomicrobiaceae bacterium]